jgi:hypothetical protein
MTTALVRRELTPDVWEMIERIAPTMKESRLFGVATQQQAAAIMLKGFELGLGLTASFEFVQVIQDKPTLSPRGALALIIQSGECIKLDIKDIRNDKGEPDRCEVTMKRRNGIEYTSSFSMDDAKRAGLVKPDSGWAKYPANMMKWRAVGFCADVVFPDVIGSMKRADELGADITPDGNVINATWTQTAQTTMSTAAAMTNGAVDPSALLNELVQKYGAEKVLVANEGRIPATMEDLLATRVKLEAGQ